MVIVVVIKTIWALGAGFNRYILKKEKPTFTVIVYDGVLTQREPKITL